MTEYVITKIEDCTANHSNFISPQTQCECKGTGKIRSDVSLIEVLKLIVTSEPYTGGGRVGKTLIQVGDKFDGKPIT